MVRVLTAGMSATGTSTVLRELVRRGHAVQDLDEEGVRARGVGDEHG